MDVPSISTNVGLLASTLKQEPLEAKAMTKALDYSASQYAPARFDLMTAGPTTIELNARAIAAVLTGKGTLLDVVG